MERGWSYSFIFVGSRRISSKQDMDATISWGWSVGGGGVGEDGVEVSEGLECVCAKMPGHVTF